MFSYGKFGDKGAVNVSDFDILSLLILVFTLYLGKLILIDTKIRKNIKRNYKKDDYVKQVMFKPYVLYIKEKEHVEPKLFWLNVCTVTWLVLSVILCLIHILIIQLKIAVIMFWCNVVFLVLLLGYGCFAGIRSELRGELLGSKKRQKIDAYVTIAIIILVLAILVEYFFKNRF